MKLKQNFCIDTDAYKVTHWLLHKKLLQKMRSYGESRKGSHFDHTIFYGMQIILIDSLEGEVVTKLGIEEAEDRSGAYFGTTKYFNKPMFNHIINKYGGMLPIKIRAVKEGKKVPIDNVLFDIESLDDKCIPLVQHVETGLMHVWGGTTIATNSHYIKSDILKHLVKSGSPELINFMCHDFGYRSTTCDQHAAIVGSAHLLSFNGSDTNIADRAAKFYYGYKEDSILKSVLASEHAIALMYGREEGEYEYVHACLDAAPPDKIVSIVIDTYDDINFIENVITRPDIKEKIMNRPGKTVFRQDSGDAIENTNRNLNTLANNFGFSHNKKHFKMLDPHIGLLQGDGMTRQTINELYESIMVNKWSADNLVVGSGSGLLVKNFERDTQRFAIKPCQNIINGEAINVCKTPKGQPDKSSKAGELKLHETGGKFMTISSNDTPKPQFEGYTNALEVVFEHGEVKRRQTFNEIRDIANGYL